MATSLTESAVSPALIQDYWDKGYIVLRGFFSADEVASWGAECDRLLQQDWIDEKNIRTPFRMNSTVTPERIDPVVDVSDVFAELVKDERILSVLRAIWKEEPVLFKDKLIFKMPGVDGYTMHQDWAWGWQQLCPADDILSVSIQIDGASAANGGIELIPNAHGKLLTPAGVQTNFTEAELAQVDFSKLDKLETQPGDVLIFHSLAPHQSGKNTVSYPRRSLYLSYNAARAGDLKADYYEGYKTRLGGGDSFFR